MSRYLTAKADLERAMLSAPRSGRERLVRDPLRDPVRYAAITVMQPYAWLIAHAFEWPEHVQGKTIENRSRATSYRGPVLIHVSRKWSRVGEQLAELRRLGLVGRGCPEPQLGVMQSQLGKVIAVGELVGCRRIGGSDPHPWAIAGAWGWELAEVELVEPFGLRGSTGLWFPAAGTSVRTLAPKLELGGLPVPHGPTSLGLVVDTSTGTAAIKVSSLVEAARVLARVGVTRFDHVVSINGRSFKAGQVLAKAAAEHGDVVASERIKAAMRSGARLCSGGLAASRCDRGPRE